MVNIAVLGYGTVGSGVVEVIDTNGAGINQRIGEKLQVKYVLDLKDFPGDPVQEKIVHDFETIIQDEEINIVVEVMGGIEPAYTFVKRSLLAGKSVATSNKALVAKHGAELLSIAKEKNINFLFEASVGGGIPIIRPLNSSLTADEIEEITGILNGTTNYMLTKMFYEGADYDTCLLYTSIILLNPPSSEYYKKTLEQAEKALRAYPGGMQIGGGVTAENASGYIEKGASHVIVTSYVFKGGKIRWDAVSYTHLDVYKRQIKFC